MSNHTIIKTHYSIQEDKDFVQFEVFPREYCVTFFVEKWMSEENIRQHLINRFENEVNDATFIDLRR